MINHFHPKILTAGGRSQRVNPRGEDHKKAIDKFTSHLPKHPGLPPFRRGVGVSSTPRSSKGQRAQAKGEEHTFHWAGSEGRALLLILPWVLFNCCGPTNMEPLVIHFNRAIFNLYLFNALSLVAVKSETLLVAMDNLYAAFQFECIQVATVITAINLKIPKFHVGSHEAYFYRLTGNHPLTTQHLECELRWTAMRASDHANGQQNSGKQMEQWRNVTQV